MFAKAPGPRGARESAPPGPHTAASIQARGLAALVEAAARALRAPVSTITLYEGDAVTLRTGFGAARDLTRTYGESRLCRSVAEQRATLVVSEPDELAGVRAFAGAPIVTSSGAFLGTLAAFDTTERTFDAHDVAVLESFATLAASHLAVEEELFGAAVARSELSTLIDASPIAIATIDGEGRVRAWSPAAERLFGVVAEEAIGCIVPSVPGGRENRDFREMLAALRRGATYLTERTRWRRRDGSNIDVRVSAAPIVERSEEPNVYVVMVESIDELHKTAMQMRLFESIVLTTSDAVVITSGTPYDQPIIQWCNDAFELMFGYSREEIVGKSTLGLRASSFPEELAREVVAARRKRVPARFTAPYVRKDGELLWCDFSHTPIFDPGGNCESFAVVVRDVTAQRRAEQLHEDRGEILELIASDAPLDRIFAALVSSAERARPNAGATIRLRRGEFMHRVACGPALAGILDGATQPTSLARPEDPCTLTVVEQRQLVFDCEDGATTAYARLARENGIVAAWSTPMFGKSGDPIGTFTLHSRRGMPTADDLRLGSEYARLAEIALARRKDREELEFLALHDGLTGLPNRTLFEDRLAQAIATAEKHGRTVVVGMIDLDRFKVVNDSLGHAVGDKLLQDVARRLEARRRAGDTVARLGGDEFVVLINDLESRAAALDVAERLIASLVPGFAIDEHEVFVRASMGLASFPEDSRHAAGLFTLSDAAMYDAKSKGRHIAFHEPGVARVAIARVTLESSLNRALENGELSVLYQPLVDLRTSETRGAEALLRWNHASLGLVLPDAFVRIAEESGLIVPIGAWVLEEACRFVRVWQDEGLDRFVSVNVSARQFDQRDFVSTVVRVLGQTGAEPSRLHLELTEGLVMRSPEAASATLGELKALGVKIVIDDFGTGYSSFNYLKRFPLDVLKIDRLFVRDIGFGNRAPGDEAIVRAIVGVARALDLKIVAEGVENEDQVAFLRAIGVPLAQGFLFAPGLTRATALRWSRAARQP